MRVTPKLCTLGAAALLGLLSGCGTSAETSTTTAPQPSSTVTSAAPTAAPTSAGAPATSKAPAAEAALITIKDFKFTVPASVSAGSKVTVMNKDGENHSVTSTGQGAFNVTAQAGGKAITFTAPTKPGTYPFVCMFHGNMKGTLVVK